MMNRRFVLIGALAALTATSNAVLAQGDPKVVADIIEEGKSNNQVWSHLEYLSHEIGPRLTGSERLERANNWTLEKFKEFGLQNGHLHQWGEINVRFDRGESYARITEPITHELEFTTPAWTPGTDGPVTGPVIKLPESMEELDALGEELENAWVLTRGRQRGSRRGVVPPGSTPEVAEEINAALIEAGIAGRIIANRDELVRTFSGQRWDELKEMTLEEALDEEVTIYVRRSDYDAMNSRLADGERVVVEANLDNKLTEGPFPLYNTIAEIPGTEWPEQVVIVSAHLDSWDGPGSFGTQDNGTGSSVTLEAARILMAVGAKPKRTIRFILWTGEEQGLLGARGYVDSLSETERANISACFVDDGGTNYEGGLECVESMKDMLTEATAPVSEAFPDMPVEILVRERMPRGGGSDHAAFNAVGIPGFFWDERGSGGREGKNYRYIHHTQHDTPRYAVPEYLVQSATCAAVTAYNLACADTLLPRAPQEEDTAEEDAEDSQQRGGRGLFGEWNARILIGEEPAENAAFTISLTRNEEGGIGGYTESQMGRGEITEGSFDFETRELTFTVKHEQFGEIIFKATLEDGKLSGTLSAGEQFTAPFEAERREE